MQSYLFIVVFFVLGLASNYLLPLCVQQKQLVTLRANQWIIYVALTAIIFLNVPQLEFSLNALLPTLVAWSCLFVSALMVHFLANKLKLRRDIKGAMLLLVPLGNTSFIGYPMISTLLNDNVLGYAIFYDQLGSFVALSTYATFVLAYYSQPIKVDGSLTQVSISYRQVLIKIITFPPFISLMVALFAPLDLIVATSAPLLSILAATLMPLALFTLGLQFNPKLVPEQMAPLALSISIKMFLIPLLVWLVLRNITAPIESIQASIMESAMPPMMTPGILAIQAGLAPRFCATLLGYSTLLSILTLPLIAYYLKLMS